MNTTNQPSERSLKCAEEIYCAFDVREKPVSESSGDCATVESLAAIIDRHFDSKPDKVTGKQVNQRLLEAAKLVVGMAAIWQIDPSKSPATMNVAFTQLQDAIQSASQPDNKPDICPDGGLESELAEALRDVEWIWDSEDGELCSNCGGGRHSDRHSKECKLSAVLRKYDSRKKGEE
jgi:hypothetical protein